MDITINLDTVKEHGLSVQGLLYLLSVYFEIPINDATIKEVARTSYIAYDSFTGDKNSKPKTDFEGKEFVEDIFFKSDMKKKKEPYEQYLDMAKAMQECYPKGYKETDRGKYPWRDSVGIIAKKLWSLKKKYPYLTFTTEEAVDATKRYVESFADDTTYMATLKYFILSVKEEEKSPFMAYLEDKTKVEVKDKNWNNDLR